MEVRFSDDPLVISLNLTKALFRKSPIELVISTVHCQELIEKCLLIDRDVSFNKPDLLMNLKLCKTL